MTAIGVYVNEKQDAFLSGKQRYKDIIGGRGSGKTGLIGHHNIDKLNAMPGAKSGLAALTYNQLLNNSLPSMENIWRLSGLVEHTKDQDGHYVVGVRPPEWWNKPLSPPRSYSNIISFVNGYHIQLISLDRPDTIRGLSLDALDVDEKGWAKETDFNQILVPLVRGNVYEYDSYLHHSICGFSSMPWLAKQQWILDVEELAKVKPEKYFYIESTAEDNLAVLGDQYLEDARERLPHIVFMVEYMNMRPKRISNAFYPAFNDEVHCDFRTFHYDQNESGLWISKPSDVHRDKPLELSFDFNAAFTSAIVCQDHGTEFRVVDELFIEEATTNMISDITQKFVGKYSDHPNKDVFVYGDRNGNNRSAGDNLTFYERIILQLTAAGFNPMLMVHGLDSNHKKRYFLINSLLEENDVRAPRIRINQNNCKYLPISLQLAPMVGDFEKDKTSERPGNDQKKATHFSDCLDNILWAKYNTFLASEAEYYEAKTS